jgi:hypothetical protein
MCSSNLYSHQSRLCSRVSESLTPIGGEFPRCSHRDVEVQFCVRTVQGVAQAHEAAIAGETSVTRTSPSLSETSEQAVVRTMTMSDATKKPGGIGAAPTFVRSIGAPFTVPARCHLRSSSLARAYALAIADLVHWLQIVYSAHPSRHAPRYDQSSNL